MQKYIHFDLHTRQLIARKINVEGLSYEIISQHLCVAKSAVWNEVRRKRRQRGLGKLTPVEFETAMMKSVVLAA